MRPLLPQGEPYVAIRPPCRSNRRLCPSVHVNLLLHYISATTDCPAAQARISRASGRDRTLGFAPANRTLSPAAAIDRHRPETLFGLPDAGSPSGRALAYRMIQAGPEVRSHTRQSQSPSRSVRTLHHLGGNIREPPRCPGCRGDRYPLRAPLVRLQPHNGPKVAQSNAHYQQSHYNVC